MFARFKELVRVFGWHSLWQRTVVHIERRLGLLRRRTPPGSWDQVHPASILLIDVPSTEEGFWEYHHKQDLPRIFAQPLPDLSQYATTEVLAEAQRFLEGELRYFNGEFLPIGYPPRWNIDLSSGREWDLGRHWTRNSHSDPGDVKYLWEPSRFTWAWLLLRAGTFSGEEKWADAFWQVFEDWLSHNQPNRGPNWMDGQEVALRLIAVLAAVEAFSPLPSFTPRRLTSVLRFVYVSARRIHANLRYADATNSNHAISEATALWMAALFFPELRGAAGWNKTALDMLERQVNRQFFPDGGYSMYSDNYHRFSTQLLALFGAIQQRRGLRLPEGFRERMTAVADYLHAQMDPLTGRLQNTGSNDGSLPLPLNSCNFLDFRPLVQLCSAAGRGVFLLPPGPWDEDALRLFGELPLQSRPHRPPPLHFPQAGRVILGGEGDLAFLNAVHFISRPSQDDVLHVSLRMHGLPIAIDAGTFSYHAAPPWHDGLAGASIHNTLTVSGSGAMRRLGPFTWGSWSQARVLTLNDEAVLVEQDGFLRLHDPLTHRRHIQRLPGGRWLVTDHVRSAAPQQLRLQWLLSDFPWHELESALVLETGVPPVLLRLGCTQPGAAFSVVRAGPHSTRGWQSPAYGVRLPALSAVLEVTASEAFFWSFLGDPQDTIKPEGSMLHLTIAGKTEHRDLNRLTAVPGETK